jgi:DNA repair protein RadD
MKLRPYQEVLKKAIYDAWDEGHKNVLAVKPTGMGKTKTFVSIAMDMALDPKGPRLPTAIMVHRKELVQQISLTLAEEGVQHNIIAPRPVIKGIVAAHRQVFKKQFYDYNACVTVISVDTLNARILKHEKWAKSIKLWITDEAAHLLLKNKWGRAVQYFTNAIGLGVTATPQRLDKRGLGRHADGVFDIMVQGPTSRWGIDNGYLCNYKIAIPASDYRNFLRAASEGSDYTREAMAQASAESHIVGDVVENYIKFANGKQAIVFASDIDAGRRIEKEFETKGISAKLLTGLTDDKTRLQALLDYREKKIQVLINVDLFDEGLDVPGIECVIMARPTMSLGKYLQMIGRGLRPLKGKEFLIIIDHVGNVVTHGLPDRPRKWTLDRIVKRRDKTNLIRICENVVCNSPFDRILTACPYCGWEIPKPKPGSGAGRIGPQQVDGDLELLDPQTLRQLEAQIHLEDPSSVGARVAAKAGGPAGIKATKNQMERIETQRNLIDTIAKWAGRQRYHGYKDREIHKKFYLQFDRTITEALAEPKAEMLEIIEQVQGDVF